MKLENLSKETRNELCNAFQLLGTASDEQLIIRYKSYCNDLGISPDVDIVPNILRIGYENAKAANNFFKLNAARDTLSLYILICGDRNHVDFEKFVVWFVINNLNFVLTQTSQLQNPSLAESIRAQLAPLLTIFKAINLSLEAIEFSRQKRVPTTQTYINDDQVQAINVEINKLYGHYTNSESSIERHILRKCLLMLNRVVLSLKLKEPIIYLRLDTKDCNARLIELVNDDMANRKLLVGSSSQTTVPSSTAISIGNSNQTFMPAPTDTTPLLTKQGSEERSNNTHSKTVCCLLL